MAPLSLRLGFLIVVVVVVTIDNASQAAPIYHSYCRLRRSLSVTAESPSSWSSPPPPPTATSMVNGADAFSVEVIVDRLLHRMVSSEKPLSAAAPSSVVVALDGVLERQRALLDRTAAAAAGVLEGTTARSIAQQCRPIRRLIVCNPTQVVRANSRCSFIKAFLRSESATQIKIGALLMAITPIGDLTLCDVSLVATLFVRAPVALVGALAPLLYQLVARIPPDLLGVADHVHVLKRFVTGVVIRVAPVHDPGVLGDSLLLARPGPVIQARFLSQCLDVLLRRCSVSEVRTTLDWARGTLRPRFWAQLFLDGALRVYVKAGASPTTLTDLFGAEHALHVLVEFAVRVYRPVHVLLLVLAGETFITGIMAKDVPLSLQGAALKTLLDSLGQWYQAQRHHDAIPVVLSHLSTRDLVELAHRLVATDWVGMTSVAFWAQLWQLHLYGELHYYLMSCTELQSTYMGLDPSQKAGVALTVAAWNEQQGPLPCDKVRRQLVPESYETDLETVVSQMLVNLLRGVRQQQGSVPSTGSAAAADRHRLAMMMKLIASSWATLIDYEPILCEAFSSASALTASDWAAALNHAVAPVGARAFRLFYHVVTDAHAVDDLRQWHLPLARQLSALDWADLDRLLELNPEFFGDVVEAIPQSGDHSQQQQDQELGRGRLAVSVIEVIHQDEGDL